MAIREWIRYDLGLPRVSDADLDALESGRQLTLPEEFRETLTAHAGDRPRPGVCPVGRGSVSVAEFFVVQADRSGRSAYNVWHYLEAFDELVPDAEKLIPFASNGGQAIFALDYRHGGVPGVSLVDLDLPEEPDAITPVASDFSSWMGLLHD